MKKYLDGPGLTYLWEKIKNELNNKADKTHRHGNITSGGTLQTTDVTIENGDKLVITDANDTNKVARSSVSFDASTITKALTQKGTWENVVNSVNNKTGGVVLNADDVNAVHDYSKEYLTFEALEDTTFTFTTNALQYSLDDGATWTILSANTASPTVTAGNKILWKQTGLTPTSSNGIGTFSATGNYNASGNIMSLYYGDDFIGQIDLTVKDYALFRLFYICSKLVNAKNLILPATTLSNTCYDSMFSNCTSLTTAPEILPATTLADNCYNNMFCGCTSLTKAPELPATILTDGCYGHMFDYCTSLVTSPELPATSLANGCYSSMFIDCESLTTAPELPATTLADSCYIGMFEGCTSLVTAPEILPATTLADYCYNGMFQFCTSLTKSPELPATTLADDCYFCMFRYCTSLTEAPELPATTLSNNCYAYMFEACTLITTAPELPATTLADGCYTYMFRGCTSLNYIKCLASDISAIECTFYWVNNVSLSGTFIKADSMTSWTIGNNGIPTGWSIYTESEYKEVRHYELSSVISGVTHTFFKNVICGDDIKIWIDDFSTVSIEEMYDNYRVGNVGYKKYHLTQDTITIDGITYYIWEGYDEQGYDYDYNKAYILTTTNDYDELLNQSLDEDLNYDFTSFGGFLNEDSEESYADDYRIQYILNVEQNNNELYIYVDNIRLNGFDDGRTIYGYINDPESYGSNPYILTSNTIEIDGETYFIWERADEDEDEYVSAIHYLLTTSDDYETLESHSLEASKYNLAYKPNSFIFAFMDEDNEIYESTTLNIIVKVENV